MPSKAKDKLKPAAEQTKFVGAEPEWYSKPKACAKKADQIKAVMGKGISVVYIDSYQNMNQGIQMTPDPETGELTETDNNDAVRYRTVDTTYKTLIDRIDTTMDFFIHPGNFQQHNWLGMKWAAARPTYKMG